MNTKSYASVVMVFALGCFALSASANMKYTPEYTNTWCTVTNFVAAPSVNAAIGGGTGGWSEVPAGGVALKSSALSIDTVVTDPLVYTNQTGATGLSRIVTTLTVSLSSELPTIAGAKTAICVCTNGVVGAGAKTNWWAYIGGSWTQLNGTPVVDATYEIVLDLDADADPDNIRYLAKKISGTPDTEYATLTDDWVSNGDSGAAITKIAFAGSTTLDNFSGKSFTQGYAYNGEVYASIDSAAEAAESAAAGADLIQLPIDDSVASANISLDWITNNASGATLSAKLADLNENGANGIKKWQSYVLGLTPSVETSKPIVQPVQNTDDNVSFTLGNVALASGSGVGVQYRVSAYASPTSTEPIDGGAGTYVDAGENATADLPPSGVLYYKLDVKFD